MENNTICIKVELDSKKLKVYLTRVHLKCTILVNIGNAKTGPSTRNGVLQRAGIEG